MLSYSTQYSDVSVPDSYISRRFFSSLFQLFLIAGFLYYKGGREALYVYTVVLNSWYYFIPGVLSFLNLNFSEQPLYQCHEAKLEHLRPIIIYNLSTSGCMQAISSFQCALFCIDFCWKISVGGQRCASVPYSIRRIFAQILTTRDLTNYCLVNMHMQVLIGCA